MSETDNTTTPATSGAEAGAIAAAAAKPTLPMLSLLEGVRSAIAGVLMGTANLIPGVSGGTMILAMGVYEEFIDGVAEVTRLQFSKRRIAFLAIVGACAASAIVGLSGVILYLLFHSTVAMFSLFIGLTLGGVPLLLKSVRPLRADVIIALLVGFGAMVGVVFMKQGAGFPHNTAMDVTSGVIGATTMVLPGISGSYMLLVMDQYDRVVGSVRDVKDALEAHDFAAMKAAMMIVIPVGIGAVFGIMALTNILKVLLHRFHRPTVGVLLGVLLGSVLGLWPFTQSVGEKALQDRPVAEIRAYAARWSLPGVDQVHASGEMDEHEALIAHVTDHAVWSKRTNPPITGGDAGVAVLMVAIGFGATSALSRLGSA